MSNATSVRWVPSEAVVSLVARIIEQHKETALKDMRENAGKIANRRSASGTLTGGNHLVEVRDAHMARVREYAVTVTREVIEVASDADGTLDRDGAAWIRATLEPHFEAMASGIAQAIEESSATRGLIVDRQESTLRRGLRDAVTTFADRLKLDLGIALDKAAIRSEATGRAKRFDPTTMDALVPLPAKRAYDTDIEEAIATSLTANEPLALVTFDIDKFKSVNDEGGGHHIGNEALIAVAQIAAACTRGKGTVYRVGGDEFMIVLPNHAAHEAIAVAERIRRTVNEKRLTSRSLTISLSMGIAVAPEHAADVSSLEQAADKALYDAKDRGRNLVRVFQEPPPPAPGPREPERRVPEPGGLTDEQRTAIRRSYFKHGFAECPHDGAMLRVENTTCMGQKRDSILVDCPECGLNEEIE
jgi:diguanylate cyclase (GGDEF)-like protein